MSEQTEPTMLICGHCGEEIRRVGEDALDWCESCQCLEGPTERITEDEYERRNS